MRARVRRGEHWAEGVEWRADGTLGLRLSDRRGIRSMGGFERIVHGLYQPEHRYFPKLTLDLREYHREEAAGSTRALGVPHWDASGQDLFIGNDEQLSRLAIPSQVMVVALFGRMAAARDHLFCPLGPYAVCDTTLERRRLVLVPAIGPQAFELKGGLVELMQWVHQYPSAVKSWSSVYHYGLNGKLSLELPSAVIDASVSAVWLDGIWYASNVKVLRLHAAEEPMPFAAKLAQHTFHFLQHPFESFVKVSPKRRTSSIARCDVLVAATGGRPLTGSQWQHIEPLLEASLYMPRRKNRRYTRVGLREAFNWLIVKLSTGTPWNAMASQDARWTAQTVYLELKAKGAWEPILRRLAECRPAAN